MWFELCDWYICTYIDLMNGREGEVEDCSDVEGGLNIVV